MAKRRPQRRVRRRVGPSRVRWDRVGRIALVLVLFAVLASYLNPLVNLAGVWKDSKATEERLAELKREHVDLQQQLDEAESPVTLGREARKMGMIKPGERLYVIEGLD